MLGIIDLYNDDYHRVHHLIIHCNTHTFMKKNVGIKKRYKDNPILSISQHIKPMYYGDIVSSQFKIIKIDCNESQSYFSDYYLPNLEVLIVNNSKYNVHLSLTKDIKVIYSYHHYIDHTLLPYDIKHLQIYDLYDLPSLEDRRLKSLEVVSIDVECNPKWIEDELVNQDELETLIINSNMINLSNVQTLVQLKSLKFILIDIINTSNTDIFSIIDKLSRKGIKVGLYSIGNTEELRGLYRQLSIMFNTKINNYDNLQLTIDVKHMLNKCIENHKLLKYCDCVLCKPLGTYEGKDKLVIHKGYKGIIDANEVTILGCEEGNEDKEYCIKGNLKHLTIYESGTYYINNVITIDVKVSNVKLIVDTSACNVVMYDDTKIELWTNIMYLIISSYHNNTNTIDVCQGCKTINTFYTNKSNIQFKGNPIEINNYSIVNNLFISNMSDIDYTKEYIKINNYDITLSNTTTDIPLLYTKDMNYILSVYKSDLLQSKSKLEDKCREEGIKVIYY